MLGPTGASRRTRPFERLDSRSNAMRRHFVFLVLLATCACSKDAQKPSEQPAVASASVSAVVPSAPASAAPSAAEPSGAWYVGTWKGDFTAAKRQAVTSTKEGAPAAWDKDDGKRLAGPSSMEITVTSAGAVTGRVKGSLGDLGVRGKVEGEELRASLVPQSDDLTAIQNGYVVMTRDADTLKGRLSAASGDALVLRHGEMTLKKSIQP